MVSAWVLVALAAIAAVGVLQTVRGTLRRSTRSAPSLPSPATRRWPSREAPTTEAEGDRLKVAFAITIHDVDDGGDYRWALATRNARAVGETPRGTVRLEAGESATVQISARVGCEEGAKRVWVGAQVDPEPAASVGTWVDCPEAKP